MDGSLRISAMARRAVRVLSYLVGATEREGQVFSSAAIGEALGIPRGQLAKVLRRLVDAGRLVSRRGRGGGFSARRDARHATLLELVEQIDGSLERFAPPAGGGDVLRQLQRSVLEQVRRHLAATRIADLLEPPHHA